LLRHRRLDHPDCFVDYCLARLWEDDDGEIGFTAGPAVQVSLPTAEYCQAVHELDQELMTAMRQRVEELDRRGGLPGVELDLAVLRRDHEDRARWRAGKLDPIPKTDWDAPHHRPRSRARIGSRC
jgi:hypothetical protein